jgi:hypothetical protein
VVYFWKLQASKWTAYKSSWSDHVW